MSNRELPMMSRCEFCEAQRPLQRYAAYLLCATCRAWWRERGRVAVDQVLAEDGLLGDPDAGHSS